MPEGTKTEEQLKAELTEQLKGQPQPLEFRIEETGEVVKGKDMNEVLENLKKMHVHTRQAYQQEKAKADALLATVKEPEPTPNGDSQFNSQKYWEMVNGGQIIEAQNYVDSFRFGIPADEIVDTFAGAVNDAKFAKDEIVSAKFKMENNDYPATAEAADAVTAEIKRMQEEARREGEAVPKWSVRTLNAAWESVKKGGKVQPLSTDKEPERTPGAPPPMLRGGGGNSRTMDEELTELIATKPLAEVEAALRKAGRLA